MDPWNPLAHQSLPGAMWFNVPPPPLPALAPLQGPPPKMPTMPMTVPVPPQSFEQEDEAAFEVLKNFCKETVETYMVTMKQELFGMLKQELNNMVDQINLNKQDQINAVKQQILDQIETKLVDLKIDCENQIKDTLKGTEKTVAFVKAVKRSVPIKDQNEEVQAAEIISDSDDEFEGNLSDQEKLVFGKSLSLKPKGNGSVSAVSSEDEDNERVDDPTGLTSDSSKSKGRRGRKLGSKNKTESKKELLAKVARYEKSADTNKTLREASSVRGVLDGYRRAQQDDDLTIAKECGILLPNGFTPMPPLQMDEEFQRLLEAYGDEFKKLQ